MDTVTFGEMNAFQILHGQGIYTTNNFSDYHKAGNEIIALAEQIKAERAVAAMSSPFFCNARQEAK